MPIAVTLGDVMKDRGVGVNELAGRVGMSNVNLSRIKTGKIKAVRLGTPDAICRELKCQPGDLLRFEEDGR